MNKYKNKIYFFLPYVCCSSIFISEIMCRQLTRSDPIKIVHLLCPDPTLF